MSDFSPTRYVKPFAMRSELKSRKRLPVLDGSCSMEAMDLEASLTFAHFCVAECVFPVEGKAQQRAEESAEKTQHLMKWISMVSYPPGERLWSRGPVRFRSNNGGNVEQQQGQEGM
ncbi:hypothetical protein LOC100632312 [Anopheles sinensis]|uniref:Uncharacterized protein n=1 Tax=Anopheles sinensis TaxID=74873 RepID=A0A084VEK8_ANOSI|nr:hypothetical protein LOC100632312 [Anopheles sinensis]